MFKQWNDAGEIERNIRGKPKTLCTTKTESYRIPESLSAFCRIVSLTAAKTRRILLVSVACVKLDRHVSDRERPIWLGIVNILRVEIQMSSVNLVESPQQVLGSFVDIVASRVVREIVPQW